MSVLSRLSSQVGDRTEESNRRVAREALEQPSVLAEIAKGLSTDDPRLVGDCAEVMTMVAEQRPELVMPYVEEIVALLSSGKTRVRWEVMHAIALVARLVPERIAPMIGELGAKIKGDRSVIVRDWAVYALGEYGSTSKEAAQSAFSILAEALTAWEGKQSGKALEALGKVVASDASQGQQAASLAEPYLTHKSSTVRRVAKKLIEIRQATVSPDQFLFPDATE